MLAFENPHCGVSGVPFMNSTTGLEATAWSIAALVSVDRSRDCEGVRRVRCNLDRVGAVGREDRDAWRNPCSVHYTDHQCTMQLSPARASSWKSSQAWREQDEFEAREGDLRRIIEYFTRNPNDAICQYYYTQVDMYLTRR